MNHVTRGVKVTIPLAAVVMVTAPSSTIGVSSSLPMSKETELAVLRSSAVAESPALYNVTVTASDADDDTVIFLDNTTLFDINYLAGNISFKPAHDEVGNSYVKITASDINGSNCEDWVNIKFTILDVNDPPVAKIDYPENGSRIDRPNPWPGSCHPVLYNCYRH